MSGGSRPDGRLIRGDHSTPIHPTRAPEVRLAVGAAAEVKSRLSIVDVVAETVPLKKAGTTYKGLCPFHGEKTPSFVVTPARETYHCFGCGKGGDVFNFVMERDGLSFPEALRVAGRQGRRRARRADPPEDARTSPSARGHGDGDRLLPHRPDGFEAGQAGARLPSRSRASPTRPSSASSSAGRRRAGTRPPRRSPRDARSAARSSSRRASPAARQGSRGGVYDRFRARDHLPDPRCHRRRRRPRRPDPRVRGRGAGRRS